MLSVGGVSNVTFQVPSPLSVATGPPFGSQFHHGPVRRTADPEVVTDIFRPVGSLVAQVDLVSIDGRSSFLNIQLPPLDSLLQRTSNEVESGAPLFQVILTVATPFASVISETPAASPDCAPIRTKSTGSLFVDLTETSTLLASTLEIVNSTSDAVSASMPKCVTFVAQYCVASVVPPPVEVPAHASYTSALSPEPTLCILFA